MKRLARFFIVLGLGLILHCSVASAQAPSIFFTDLTSGPNSGGENVSNFAGTYATIYGNYFGATQGSSTVTLNGASCLRVVSWGSTYLWYQKIVVQLGPNCTSGNFVVTTSSGASNGTPFTVRAGNIYCVSTSGNDSSSGKFPSSCWATLPHAIHTMNAGDITYAQNGVTQTAQDPAGYSANLSITSSGTAGSPIALVAYPGATVTVGTGNNAQSYAIRTPNIGGYHYWVIAGLVLRSSNIALEPSGGSSFFWAVGNDISCPTAIGNLQGGCADTANIASNIQYLGNYIHDNAQVSSSGATKGFHSVYFSTDSNHVVVAWNLVNGDTGVKACNGGQCNSCRGIQFHSSPVGNGTGLPQYDLHVHDNFILNQHCDGVNLATVDPSKGTVEVYNNVIAHVGTGVITGDISSYVGILLQDDGNGTGAVQVYNNTLYDCGLNQITNIAGYISNNGITSGMTMVLRNNIVYSTGMHYFQDSATMSAISGSNNIWVGAGNGPSQTTSNLNLTSTQAGTLFASLGANNFQLTSSSAARGAGTASMVPIADVSGDARPSPPSVGAYELYTGTVAAKPAAPTNLQAVVN